MGYKQKKFQPTSRRRRRRRDTEVWTEGVQKKWPCPLEEQIMVFRFLALKDISEDVKADVLLLTRYMLKFFRGCGFGIAVDSFAKKANIDEPQPLDGYFGYNQYLELWSKGPREFPDYWTFCCHKKFEAFRKQTSQGNDLNITTTIPRLTVILSLMVRNLLFVYFLQAGRNYKEPKSNEEQPHGNQLGSTSSNSESIASRVKKRRRCGDESMNIQG